MYSNDLSGSKTHLLRIAGVDLSCIFRFEETCDHFGKYYMGRKGNDSGIYVLPSEWDHWIAIGNKPDSAGEFSLMTSAVSDELLKYERCIIHAAAFSYKGEAWLIVAPPGVGKSTQIRTLQELYPDEFSVICGDRPVLERKTDGSFFVHPSPWNGKEHWHGADGAPLSGILALERGESTCIELYTKKEAVFPVFFSLISNMETEDTIRRLADMENTLLAVCPVYRYVNGGVPDSTRYLYERLFRKDEEDEI